MRVSGIQAVQGDSYCELRARVKFDTHWVWGDEPFELWYRFPAGYGQYLAADNGDPFLAAFLAPAMVLGEPLHIEAAVSRKLMAAVRDIQTIYRCWDARYSEVAVEAEPRNAVSQPRETTVALFFSMGVDSSYCLTKDVACAPDANPAITHLIVVEGFDVYLWESHRFPPLLDKVQKVAAALHKEVLPVTTNLRDMSDRVVDWLHAYHGPALASVVLALGRMFGEARISAGQTYRRLLPVGTHPLLDPLWSTESLTFRHVGLEADRLEKISSLTKTPILLENLRVCATGELTDAYNCGRCEKCIRTMLCLHVAGALEQCKTLPHRIDTELLASLDVPSLRYVPEYEKIVGLLSDEGADGIIKEALQQCIAMNRLRA